MTTAEESARAFIGADALAGIGYQHDLDVATRAIEFDRAQRLERDRAHHVKHEPRDWFTRDVYPWCSCGYVPLNNADLIDHWHENGIEWVDEHGRLVSRPYESKED